MKLRYPAEMAAYLLFSLPMLSDFPRQWQVAYKGEPTV
jgi:hypothetical protein